MIASRVSRFGTTELDTIWLFLYSLIHATHSKGPSQQGLQLIIVLSRNACLVARASPKQDEAVVRSLSQSA